MEMFSEIKTLRKRDDDLKHSGVKSNSTVQSKRNDDEYGPQQVQDDLDQMMRGSLFFEKFSCFCPGTIPLEMAVFKQVYMPDEDIEFTLIVSKVLRNIASVSLTLLMDL